MSTQSKRDDHLGVLGGLPRAKHDVGLSSPSCLESGPREPNLAIVGHPHGAQDHPRDGQTRPVTTMGFENVHAVETRSPFGRFGVPGEG